MTRVVLLAEGLCDDPVEDLGGRTPLELAKAPALAALARKGALLSAALAPRQLPPLADVACLTVMGYDPLEFYTGSAPFEAEALGVRLSEGELAVCLDLVTALDGVLVDAQPGSFSRQEAATIMGELASTFNEAGYAFHPGPGTRAILVVKDPTAAEAMDDLVCTAPQKVVGQKYAKYLPKGKAEKRLLDIMEKARTVLEASEINRVRIDLGENPANFVWPWGQGKKPAMPGFSERFGVSGSFSSPLGWPRGLARLLGLKVVDGPMPHDDGAVHFVHFPAPPMPAGDAGLKARIRHIEEFDASVVAPVAAKLGHGIARVLVTAGCVESSSRGMVLHDRSPVLMAGEGLGGPAEGFSERAAARSGKTADQGWRMMEEFLRI